MKARAPKPLNRRLLRQTATHIERHLGERPAWPPRSWRRYARWVSLQSLATRLRQVARRTKSEAGRSK